MTAVQFLSWDLEIMERGAGNFGAVLDVLEKLGFERVTSVVVFDKA